MTRPRTPLRSLVLLITTTLAGCANRAPTSSPTATTHARVTPPLRYADYGRPCRITPAQLDDLASVAAQRCPADHSVWFLLILDNRYIHGRPLYNAVIYYTPDRTSDRFRAGPYTQVDQLLRLEMPRHLIEQLDSADPRSTLGRYVQVSAPYTMFPANALSVPRNLELPFDAPEGLSEADTVAIIDAARQVQSGELRLSRPPEPVLSISVENGAYKVAFGWSCGGLSGGGSIVTVHRTPTGFRADPLVTMWVS